MAHAQAETEIATLAERYGNPLRLQVELTGTPFDPLGHADRFGEVCMVVRRRDGRLITARKVFYPPQGFRLLTGGIGHDETIEAALLRETYEETGLDVAICRFLAVIEYQLATDSAVLHFLTCAFLLDEQGGELAPHDPNERIAEFRMITPAELPAMAAALEDLRANYDAAIGGHWRDWGRFRAVVHYAVHRALMQPAAAGE
ncbi:MAG TPA: NUDIX hydrolase [Roseiflexaceae bacterium]|nr:NUDIX hydrolase [Roseiflexaceae bacterium]HMP41805.1 NUDIX hydrolase [Roseiflexaceae bacterium]